MHLFKREHRNTKKQQSAPRREPGMRPYAPHYALRHSVRPMASAIGLGRGYILGLGSASDVHIQGLSPVHVGGFQPLSLDEMGVLKYNKYS